MCALCASVSSVCWKFLHKWPPRRWCRAQKRAAARREESENVRLLWQQGPLASQPHTIINPSSARRPFSLLSLLLLSQSRLTISISPCNTLGCFISIQLHLDIERWMNKIRASLSSQLSLRGAKGSSNQTSARRSGFGRMRRWLCMHYGPFV
jgi:hypothetical protein